MSVFAILYGVPVWGFAVLWIAFGHRADRPDRCGAACRSR